VLSRPAKRVLRSLGYYRRRLASSPGAGVAVLAYHAVRDDRWPAGSMHFEELHVTAAHFDAHCAVLRALNCSILSLADWSAIASGERPLPPRAVMVTFDDGYRSILTHALPVLERHEVPAAVFVCTDPVERQTRFWWDAVAERRGEAAVEDAKSLPQRAWRELVLAEEMPASADDPHAPLSCLELQRLAAHPLVSIGAHTVTHPILANADARVQFGEIRSSRASLEDWVQRPVTAFAYPNGARGTDFTSVAEREVEAAGFEHAFAVGSGFADPRANRFAHPRFLVLDSVDANELAHRLAVSWPAAHSVLS
jgi:peptidoglycan/xylan/chitin deacetylase (PgdA/CDA1 family)